MDTVMLGKNIYRIRKSQNRTQSDIACSAGLSVIAFRNIETGASLPRASTLLNIARVLNVKLADLLMPVKTLQHVRFRSSKKMKSRDNIINIVAKWLDDFNYLENILHDYETYCLSGLRNRLPVNLSGEDLARAAAALTRKELGIDGNAIQDIAGLIESSGIKLFQIRLVSDDFFGLSVSELDGGPAIIVNVWDRISVERWIFSAAHELGHLILHLDSYCVDEMSEISDQEKEANIFASYFLMPDDAFRNEWEETAGLNIVERVLKVKRIFQVSYRTVLNRVSMNLGKEIWPVFCISLKNQCGYTLKDHFEPFALLPSACSQEPENLKSHEPEPLSTSYFVEDRLSRLVRKAIESEAISLGRGAEILGHDLDKMRALAASWI